VRKAGNQVRITAQLIEARSDTHLWSETYDRNLDDIFAIQDEIAAKVVEQLKVALLGEAPKVAHTDPEAFTLFLQARYLGLQGTAESFLQSNALYEQALAIDPNYAAAWAGLARNCINQTSNGLRPIAEGYPLAREMLQKALALDPDHAPAHARLGWIAMVYENDLAAAARHMERSALSRLTRHHGQRSQSARQPGRLTRPSRCSNTRRPDPVNPRPWHRCSTV
jgi:tetratricopeptide (TPR) repeat protein